MHSILRSRASRLTATALAGAMLVGPLAPAGVALAAPPIDTNQPAPTPNAQPDPFYTPPATIPAGQPGDIIRSRPAKAGPPTARALATATQVMYLSTNAKGQRDVVTGTILVPKGKDPKTLNIVAMNPGTTGPAFKCTVSRYINSGSFYEQPMLNSLLKAGYAVSVTDYEGYHENPKTTYIVGKSMGPAVLDGIRAAIRLPGSGLSPTAKVAFTGFSQGGAASMWAGQLHPTYAPELNVVGVSGGGVPSNLTQVAVRLDGRPAFGFLLNALIGLDNAYPEDLKLDSYLNPEGRTVLANMAAKDCTVELLLAYSGKSVTNYATDTPFLQPAWLQRVGENTLGATKINVPVYQYHASNDPIVDPRQAAQLRLDLCALGTNVQYNDSFLTGHVTTVARGNADALKFLASRFAGATPTPNCPTPAP